MKEGAAAERTGRRARAGEGAVATTEGVKAAAEREVAAWEVAGGDPTAAIDTVVVAAVVAVMVAVVVATGAGVGSGTLVAPLRRRAPVPGAEAGALEPDAGFLVSTAALGGVSDAT